MGNYFFILMNVNSLRKFILFLIILASACNTNDKQDNKNHSDKISDQTIDTTLSLSHLNSMINEQPDNARLYIKRAKHYLDNQQVQLALSDLNKSINLDSTLADGYYLIAQVYFDLNKLSYSQIALEKCIQLDTSYSDAYIKLSEMFFYAKQYQLAIKNANNALRIDKYSYYPYFLKGLIYKETGDTAKALSNFQTSIEQNPDFYDAYIQLGLLSMTNNYTLAIDYFTAALKIDSFSIEAYYARGLSYQNKSDFENAKYDYLKIITLDSTYAKAYFNLGYIYYDSDSVKEALSYFDKCIKHDSLYTKAYYNRGLCFDLLKEKHKTKSEL